MVSVSGRMRWPRPAAKTMAWRGLAASVNPVIVDVRPIRVATAV
jgi:hypothetical protein